MYSRCGITYCFDQTFLPREFPQLFFSVVYIHPRANVDIAVEVISQAIHRYQSCSPDPSDFLMGDFNKCTLDASLKVQQYTDCPNHDKILDLC